MACCGWAGASGASHERRVITGSRFGASLRSWRGGDADPRAPPEEVVGPELEALPARSTTSRSSCEPYRAFIEAELVKGRNAMTIYQDLVEHRAFDGAYNAVKRFAHKIMPSEPWVSCRFETAPGEEAQVEYGEGAPTLDPRTGKYRRPRLFVMTLGYSRHAFRKVVWNSSSEIWCRLHEEAFAFFGGTTRLLRLDNLKEGVIKPDIYDPELNVLFAAMLAYYNVVALPCRPYAPDLKGKVESAVGYTQPHGAQGPTLRDPRCTKRVLGALGRAMGDESHPRDRQATSARDV